MNLSVVVCVRNEEGRLRECLETIYANNPDEVILVDGDSNDDTVAIAREFPGIRIIESRNSSLTRDRQKGLDAARNELVAMVDADHRLRPGDLDSLLADMQEFQFDIVQSGLISHVNHGFWDAAEEATWELTQNVPGRRNMVVLRRQSTTSVCSAMRASTIISRRRSTIPTLPIGFQSFPNCVLGWGEQR